MPDTRTRYARDHSLLTPDSFVRAALPGMNNAVGIVHAAPVHGAAFTEYIVEFAPGGSMITGEHQAFVFVLEGAIAIRGQDFTRGQYAYLPPASRATLSASQHARCIVIEKPYIALPGPAPEFLAGDESKIAPTPLLGDDAVGVRTLLPGHFAFDFAVNTMTFQPGATLPMVEAHVMEHGLLMLEGEGIYRLGESWYPVRAGDFIWMAPFCPQWFGALGRTPSKYLIYKDWNRHPLSTR
jgi:(S)-ureidoglycine aminohydrolase